MTRAPSVGSTRLVVGFIHHGARLDHYLAAATSLSRRAARRLVDSGAVWRNGEPLRVQSRIVDAGDVVDIVLPAEQLGVPARPNITVPPILLEDRWLVVVDKPSGVLSQPAESSDPGELALDQMLLLGLAARDGSRPYLRLVHRLDRLTTGAVLFAHNPQALPPLARDWAKGNVDRRYLAIVDGEPSFDELNIDRPIGRDRTHTWRFRVDPDGKPARTEVSVQSRLAGGAALVECRLVTGRTHQVRVHLAAIGHAVVGDRLYGGRHDPTVSRPLLHAAGLSLPHPSTGVRITIDSPLPADMATYRGMF